MRSVGVGAGVGTGDTVGAGDVGCEEGLNSKQTRHPDLWTELSEYHEMLVLAVTETLSGPVVPLYWTPSIVSLSQHDSVEKLVTDNSPEA